MASSTLGKQRGNRRSHRNGAVCRFLAALGAGVILTFGVGASIAAATTSARVSVRDGGPGPRGQGDGRREHLGARRGRQPNPVATARGVTGAASHDPGPPAIDLPNLIGATAVTPGSAVPARSVQGNPTAATAGTAALGGVTNVIPSGATPPGQAAGLPAAAASTQARSPVARALRTARSYGVLLALAAAVAVFLMIQGRLDRRDPRILSAPAEERLTFQDFE